MQTVRYIERGKVKIVIGFDNLQIDPESTKQKALKKLSKTKLLSNLDKLQAKLKASSDIQEYIKTKEEIQKSEAEINSKYNELWQDSLCYFEPRKDEEILSPNKIKKLRWNAKQLQRGEYLTIDGKIIN